VSRAQGIVAVVPTYRPTASTIPNAARLLAEVERVVVVDDGSPAEASGVLADLEALGVHVIRLEANAGIARALNVGVEAALADPATRFVLTVDQDTLVSEGFAAHASAMHDHSGAEGRVGIVAPSVVSGQPVPTAAASGSAHLPWEPIQSGMVIAREVFGQVGMFREEFVIDCVDTDFFLRADAAGFLTVLAPACSISHQLGETRSTLPGRPGVSLHSPLRRFYMTRNRLVLLREHGSRRRRWMRHTVMAETLGLGLTLTLGSDRRRHVRAMWAGFRAFRRSELGPMPANLRRDLDATAEHVL
jgi:rhamnosyltransferase